MQNDPNNRPYYYTPPRAAGRLIRQKPSNVGIWSSFKQQSPGVQAGIISIAVLLVILALLVPYVLFSGLFENTPNSQVVTEPNQNNAALLPTAIATSVPTVVATDTPTPVSTPAAEPTLSALDKGTPSNPWGYDFNAGSFITAPPATFCSYFSCISGFWNGQGYVEECQDGIYTLAGGVGGDCDEHGGDLRPLYYHPSLPAPQPTLPAAPQPTPAPKPTVTPIVKPTITPGPRPKPTRTPVSATPTPKPA
ncbi:MAG: hypothetical protein H0U76_30995 [Ktedonobacteraceae bacterium]|nr:hypothetical protein [Ktedonobacteraceae bacterium]